MDTPPPQKPKTKLQREMEGWTQEDRAALRKMLDSRTFSKAMRIVGLRTAPSYDAFSIICRNRNAQDAQFAFAVTHATQCGMQNVMDSLEGLTQTVPEISGMWEEQKPFEYIQPEE